MYFDWLICYIGHNKIETKQTNTQTSVRFRDVRLNRHTVEKIDEYYLFFRCHLKECVLLIASGE